MKEYFNRVLSKCSKGQLIYWWVLRGLMIFAFLFALVNPDGLNEQYPRTQMLLQICANMVGMFAFEICQMFPKKTYPRYFSSYFQNITIIGFLLASFGGVFLNFYYIIPGYDKILHCFGCAEGCFVGYELVCAMQRRDKKVCPSNIAALCAFGMAFVLASGWELFEFFFDQIAGGDAQHWNFDLALSAAGGDVDKIFQIFKLDLTTPLGRQRFALMDTMGDIVLNVIGAVPMYLILKKWPYNHRGNRNINKLIEEDLAKEHKETVSA